MEFIPGPFQILNRVRSAPDRWSKRIGALGLGSKVAPLLDDAAFYARTAFPGLKKAGLRKGAAIGTGKFLGKALPITSQLFGAYEGTRRLLQGQPMHKVGLGYGYALPGPWGWANMAADLAIPGGESSSQSQISNIEEVPVTEGSGTKLITMPDGSVRRIPVDQHVSGSTVMSVDGVPVSITDKVDQFLSPKDAWLHETRNSPAQRSGAWDSDEGGEQLWQLHQQDKDFQEAKRNRTLDEFAAKYPNSQTAKKMNQKRR